MRRRLRVVLLQVRSHLPARDHERLCFLDTASLGRGELECVDLVQEPNVRWDRLHGADAFFIGGAGEYSATRDYPFTDNLREIVLRLVDEGLPLLGSCWGHHFLVRILGGLVLTDRDRGEVGTFDIALTREGRQDPLFDRLPSRFPVHLGHHDRVAELPPGMTELAYSVKCRNQIFRLDGKPIYGTQFHSEMNEDHMRERLLMYREAYLPGARAYEEFVRLLRPTPDAADLLRRFLELYT